MPPIPPLSRYVRPSYEDERWLEAQLDTVNFWALYELTREICLSREPDVDAMPLYDSVEARVVATLGTTGLRKALEVLEGTALMDFQNPWTEEELAEDSPRNYPNIEPIARPDYFGHGVDIDILRHVEALGEALLDEGFDCLGPDAAEKVEAFKSATCDDDQIAVMDWLDGRLNRMAYSKRGLNSGDDAWYHPARFSPKFIGNYPNYTLSPTCLGVEIIASGFMKKTGAQYMRAGVMRSAQENVLMSATLLTDKVDSLCEDMGLTLSPIVSEMLTGKGDQLFDHLSKDLGTHSALYVRLQSGRWYQFDSNYFASVPMAPVEQMATNGNDTDNEHGSINTELDTAYNTLEKYMPIAPNLELTFDSRIASPASGWVEYIRDLTIPDGIRERLSVLLENLTLESIFEPLRKLIIDEWLLQPYSGESNSPMFCGPVSEDELDVYGTRPIDEAFYATAEALLLRGDSLEEWMYRCRTDRHYRDRLVEDVLCIPAVLGVSLAVETSRRRTFSSVHDILELGRPAINAGFAALNNIAIHTGEPLSAHFWLSYWPDRSVVADKVALADRSRAQFSAVRAAIIEGGFQLNYSRAYRIIGKFLVKSHEELITQPEEE